MAHLKIVIFFCLIGLAKFGLGLDWKYEYNNYQYFMTQSYSDDDYTWYMARDACMAEGGDLLSIEDLDEDNFISRQYSPYSGNLWMGLNRLKDGETWEWADTRTSTLDKWYSGEPRYDYELCAYRSSRTSRYWYSENCGEKRGFMCKRVKGSVTPKTTLPTQAVGGFCPRGWIDTGTNRCYQAFGPLDTSITWAKARTLCQDQQYRGADLACANDPGEVSLLSMMGALVPSGSQYWIGVYRSYYSSQAWKWSDNTPVTVENWHNLYSTYDDGCGFTSTDLKPSGSWDVDGTCTYSKKGYICQILKDPNNIIPTPEPTQPHNCKNGYIPYEQSCYRAFTDARNFEGSRSACIQDGAKLVDIHASAENSAVQFLISKSKIKKAWLGLKYSEEKYRYEWVNNWYVNFVNWGPNEPKRTQNGGCVSLQTGGDSNWFDTDCSTQLPYVCKTTSLPPVTPPPELPGRCPNKEWFPIGGHCYYACSSGCDTYWINQEKKCNSLYKTARMVSIHDEATNHQLYQALYDDYSYGDGWLGFFKSAVDGQWRWLDGTALQYTNWANGEPPEDPSSTKQCAYMSITTTDQGKWRTSTCDSYSRGLLCKVGKITNPSPPTPVNGTCPTDLWYKYGDQCFLFRPDEFATWDFAQQNCIREGGSKSGLAKIKSWSENDFIHSGMLAATHLPQTRNFWIGMARKNRDFPFEWIDGTNVSSGFVHWGSSQPSDSTTKHCGEMNIGSSSWHNQVCSTISGYVCQAPLTPYENVTPAPPGGPDAGAVVGIVFGVLIGVLLVVLVAFFIFRHMTGNPVINFTQFSNPSEKPGFAPSTYGDEKA